MKRFTLSVSLAVFLLLLCGTMPRVNAHELTEASATVILREDGHVEVRLQVPFSYILRRTWMPNESAQAFFAAYASMPDAQFARQLTLANAAIERELWLIFDSQKGSPTHWRWPSASVVQGSLRKEFMARVTTPGGDIHSERFEVLADLRVPVIPRAVQLHVPATFGPTLLTVYRPVERWVAPGTTSAPVSLER